MNKSTQPAGEGMADAADWTRTKPCKEGFYAVRGFYLNERARIALVVVDMVDGELRSSLHENNGDHDPDAWLAIAEHSDECEWRKLSYADDYIIAERDALRQWRVDMCERLGFDCAAGAQWTTEDIASELRRDELKLIADRDRHAARCEGLEKWLRYCRDNYVEPELRVERETFKGHENCSNIAGIEGDLADINVALSPPASDAAEPLAAGVA